MRGMVRVNIERKRYSWQATTDWRRKVASTAKRPSEMKVVLLLKLPTLFTQWYAFVLNFVKISFGYRRICVILLNHSNL